MGREEERGRELEAKTVRMCNVDVTAKAKWMLERERLWRKEDKKEQGELEAKTVRMWNVDVTAKLSECWNWKDSEREKRRREAQKREGGGRSGGEEKKCYNLEY